MTKRKASDKKGKSSSKNDAREKKRPRTNKISNTDSGSSHIEAVQSLPTESESSPDEQFRFFSQQILQKKALGDTYNLFDACQKNSIERKNSFDRLNFEQRKEELKKFFETSDRLFDAMLQCNKLHKFFPKGGMKGFLEIHATAPSVTHGNESKLNAIQYMCQILSSGASSRTTLGDMLILFLQTTQLNRPLCHISKDKARSAKLFSEMSIPNLVHVQSSSEALPKTHRYVLEISETKSGETVKYQNLQNERLSITSLLDIMMDKESPSKSVVVMPSLNAVRPESDQFDSSPKDKERVRIIQFLSTAVSIFKNCDWSRVVGSECDNVVATIFYSTLTKVLTDARAQDLFAENMFRFMAYASAVCKVRVLIDAVDELTSREERFQLAFRKGHVDSTLMRSIETKLVVTLEDCIFAFSLVPPDMFNRIDLVIIAYIRKFVIGIDTWVTNKFVIKTQDNQTVNIDEENIQFIDLTEAQIVSHMLHCAQDRRDLCLKITRKSNNPNYIGICTTIDKLAKKIARDLQVEKKDVANVLKGMKSKEITPEHHYKDYHFVESRFDVIKLSEKEKESIKVLKVGKHPTSKDSVLYFAIAHFNPSNHMDFVFKTIETLFAGHLTRKCPIFCHKTQTLKTLNLTSAERKPFTFKSEATKVDARTFARSAADYIRKNGPNNCDPLLALYSRGSLTINTTLDDFAYKRHQRCLDMSPSEIENLRRFRSRQNPLADAQEQVPSFVDKAGEFVQVAARIQEPAEQQ